MMIVYIYSTKSLLMKQLLVLIALAGATCLAANNPKNNVKTKAAVATCTGANPCKACKNCKYCKRCAKDGKTCGVCK